MDILGPDARPVGYGGDVMRSAIVFICDGSKAVGDCLYIYVVWIVCEGGCLVVGVFDACNQAVCIVCVCCRPVVAVGDGGLLAGNRVVGL